MTKHLNRIKVVLAEQRKSNLWLAEQLCKDPSTVSKWCTNSSQPSLETLVAIAECMNVDVRDLLNPTATQSVQDASFCGFTTSITVER